MFERFIIFAQKENAFYHVPSIVTTPDGSILAFCEQRWQSPCDDVGECHIVMKKSKDNGQTWGGLTELRRKQGAKWHMRSAVTDNAIGNVLLMCGGGGGFKVQIMEIHGLIGCLSTTDKPPADWVEPMAVRPESKSNLAGIRAA